MRFPKILVITSCTGEKRYKPSNQLTLQDFKNINHLKQRESELSPFLCSAGDLYTGKQHICLMAGIQSLRNIFGSHIIDVKILSAGYGLISEDKLIAPYEVTFNAMKAREIDEWATHLDIHESVNTSIESYDLIFFLLGDKYLRTLSLPLDTSSKQTLIFLASRQKASSIQGMNAKVFVMPLSNAEAKKYHYGLVGLKGYLFQRFTKVVINNHHLLEDVYNAPEHFVNLLS